MFKRKRRNGKFIVGCLILLCIGFVYGYMTNNVETPNKPDTGQKIAKGPVNNTPFPETEVEKVPNESGATFLELKPENMDSLQEETDRVTQNMKLIFKTYYQKTRDTAVKEAPVPNEMVGKNVDVLFTYLGEQYPQWQIKNHDVRSVELFMIKEGISPGHFIVKQHEDIITIYKIDDEGNMTLYEQTDIPTSGLSDIDRAKLEGGIIVKGIEGVYQVLEDYSS